MNRYHPTTLFTPLFCVSLLAPFSVFAQSERAPVEGTMLLQTGEASTLALPLADVGKGPDQQNMALFQFSNLITKNDAVIAYGWETMDSKGVVNSDVAMIYKVPVINVARGTIYASTGVQRWHLPSVGSTNDWASDNAIYYSRPGDLRLTFRPMQKRW